MLISGRSQTTLTRRVTQVSGTENVNDMQIFYKSKDVDEAKDEDSKRHDHKAGMINI